MNETPTYGLVGRGRVASHMARYLELEGQPLENWHRGLESTPETALASSDVILLAVSDAAVQPFIDDHPELARRRCVHFAGGLVVDGVHGLHPLMTFGAEPYDVETYRAIPFVEDVDGVGFREIFPLLRNPAWPLSREKRDLYHALCVLAGNFTTLLWCKAFDDFERRLGLPRETLRPFLMKTCDNTIRLGPAALTGPLSRGDVATVARDLDALAGDAFEPVYRAFVSTCNLGETTA